MRLSGTSMATPMVSGAVALLLQANPSLSPAQVKLALQSGASYLPDDGLMAGGAGSVNFWTSRQIAGNGGLAGVLSGLLGAVGGPSGLSFWDAGTLTTRLYGGRGLRLLGLVDAAAAWLNPSLLGWGNVNLVGLQNPLSILPPNRLIWGQVATWAASDDVILWGDTIHDADGQVILWGDTDTTDDYVILWGDSIVTDPDPR